MDFSPFDAVLLDLDGTIYHEDHALPGAAALVRRLQEGGKPFACLSNSTSSPRRIQTRLRHMGMEIAERSIYTAGAAAADYVLDHFGGGEGHRPRVFNLATEGIQELLDGRVDWVADLQSAGRPACDVVVAGTLTNVYATEERSRAALALLRDGAGLVGVCADRVYPSPRGIEFGSGAFTAMLAYASGAEPVFTGKPERIFFEELCRRMGVAPGRCVLIGDNLESDIAGGKRVGMKTVLVYTGVARREDLVGLPADRRPDAEVKDLIELVEGV